MISKARARVESRSVPAKLVKVLDVAKMLCCSEYKVRSMIYSGELAHVKVGSLTMVSVEEVDKFIDRNTARHGSI